MRSILVLAGRDPGMTGRIDAALSVARSLGGHVSVLVDTPIAGYVSHDPLGGAYVAREAMTAALEADDRLAGDIAAKLRDDDVPFDVVQYELDPVDALATAARLNDLVVVTRSSGIAGDLAMAARCPVLALPDREGFAFPLDRACIAWDGGDEAAQALRSAVPLLTGCREVRVITVTRDVPKGFPLTDALRYLARHGIKAEMTELVCGDSAEETLAEEVRRHDAQLLVMGAFGHGRIREFLFGGVTRFFLSQPDVPALLLAH